MSTPKIESWMEAAAEDASESLFGIDLKADRGVQLANNIIRQAISKHAPAHPAAGAPPYLLSAELAEALKAVIASAHPHPMENGAMYESWQEARAALRKYDERKA